MTGPLRHPAPLATGMVLAVAAGARVSRLIMMVTLFVPPLLVALQVKVRPAVSQITLVVPQPMRAEMGLSVRIGDHPTDLDVADIPAVIAKGAADGRGDDWWGGIGGTGRQGSAAEGVRHTTDSQRSANRAAVAANGGMTHYDTGTVVHSSRGAGPRPGVDLVFSARDRNCRRIVDTGDSDDIGFNRSR